MYRTLPLLIALVVSTCSGPALAGQESKTPPSFTRIDAHAHVFQNAPQFYAMLQRLDMRLLNICVVDKHERGYAEIEPQHKMALEVFRASQGRAAWCSSFDPEDWEAPGFARQVNDQLAKTFADGAIAVKIYKSIGMELKSKRGEYIMPDNPAFAPILDFIASRNKTLFAHIAEPWAAWKPLDPASPHYGYYKANPDWHMYQHPERPSKGTILDARDRMLKAHPKLRVVGCHLGSMETDVDDIARRFDLYPNFAVDTAARVPDLMLQPREKVRAFLIKYPDRVLYATDLLLMPWEDPDETVKRWEEEYARDWKYFATNATVEYEGRKIQGLELPAPVLRRIFRENAIHWVPGLSNPH
jgi:predicted TIM-barrel fold metal-dependent hydrolase